ncbi:MAG: Rne/Rng family ribonuclease [Chthonomonadales bacterium]|nr:Rne/Rng family ribonuclease [Chthonomonadales bacterium]
MAKEIIINVGERETRTAVTEDGRLVELHIEREERVVGSLFKARVDNVLPGMDAAFVDIGLSRNAFLYVGDVLPTVEAAGNGADGSTGHDLTPTEEDEEDEEDDGAPEEGDEAPTAPDATPGAPVSRRQLRRPRSIRRSVLRQQKIGEVLKVGQELLVQVIKGPRGTKGARVSTRVSLPGRYLVLMPEADNIGVSRKIEDAKERERLKKIGDTLREPGFGIIIRTEAEDKTEQDLQGDKDFLIKLWKQIQETALKADAPAIVHQDLTLIYKTIRDVFGSDVSRLVIDDPVEYEKANELLEMVSPKLRGRIHLYTGDAPIFDHFNVEADIDRTLKRKVWLRSGGYLIFDETEALTVVDVNTGKFVGGSSLSETILKTNLDAAAEIARQLRLRDIGGIIVIDFIDMHSPRDKQQVIRALEAALKRDRARTKISNISPLGLVEMTRKRTAETISDFLTEACSCCGGRGKLPSSETVSILVERELHRVIRNGKKDREALLVHCHPGVAEQIVGEEGATVDRIERELQRAVYVRANADMTPDRFEITASDIAELDRKQMPYKRAQVVECRVAASCLQPDQGVVGWVDGYLLELNEGRKFVGQTVKVKLTDVRRSYAAASVIPGTNRALDKTGPM